MFLKFEGKTSAHTIESAKYTVLYHGDYHSVITWPTEGMGGSEEFVLSRHKDWFRMYAMNNDGKTIERVDAPER